MRLIHTAARSLHYWNLPINRTFSYRLEHSVGKREWIFHGYSRAGHTANNCNEDLCRKRFCKSYLNKCVRAAKGD